VIFYAAAAAAGDVMMKMVAHALHSAAVGDVMMMVTMMMMMTMLRILIMTVLMLTVMMRTVVMIHKMISHCVVTVAGAMGRDFQILGRLRGSGVVRAYCYCCAVGDGCCWRCLRRWSGTCASPIGYICKYF
jgi:hypothetical protein